MNNISRPFKLKGDLQKTVPPSDEGGGKTVGFGGGRESKNRKIWFFSPSVSLRSTPADGGGPLCHFVTSPHSVGSHPHQKEP